jgi:hypothetical protein
MEPQIFGDSVFDLVDESWVILVFGDVLHFPLFIKDETIISKDVHEILTTTGNGYFAECQKHSAKVQKHSANALPSVALGKGHTEEKISAKGTLPSAFRQALGKAFADRKVSHSAKFKRRDGAGT